MRALIRRMPLAVAIALLAFLNSCGSERTEKSAQGPAAQVPAWTADDMDFFLHGSMSTEVFPEAMLQAFVQTYPDLFPNGAFDTFGVVHDAGALPVGFTRSEVPHLGGLSSIGINCAVCHTGEVRESAGSKPYFVLGKASTFDAEAYFTAIITALFRTAESSNMERFLNNYLKAYDPDASSVAIAYLQDLIKNQHSAIANAIAEDPFGIKDVPAGGLHELKRSALRLPRKRLEDLDLVPVVREFLKLFHNIRAALHVPDAIPDKAPPASGPGRNNPWGLLSYSLFNVPAGYAPVKYMPVWNLQGRAWVHCDGNNKHPIQRNLAAVLGLGAPLIGNKGMLDYAKVKRHTELSEQIRAPKYPFAIDAARAARGAAHFNAKCASCHAAEYKDDNAGYYSADEVKTDANRVKLFDAKQAEMYNKFNAELKIDGYTPPETAGFRSTQKYWAGDLAGVWARAPYLHNGAVRTVWDLLTPPAQRPKSYRRGSNVYDAAKMGFADEGHYVLDTTTDGNSNQGHDYGTDLNDEQKHELIEYLKQR